MHYLCLVVSPPSLVLWNCCHLNLRRNRCIKLQNSMHSSWSWTRTSLELFRRIWRTCCPDIVILLPRSDLCAFCHKYFTSQSELAGKSEEEKLKIIRYAFNIILMPSSCFIWYTIWQDYFSVQSTAQAHLLLVKEEREAYHVAIRETRAAFAAAVTAGLVGSCGSKLLNKYQLCMYLSFDFAQMVHLPFDLQQPGPVYFLTLYKLGIFGIMNDTTRNQCNFLIPEAVDISKRANGVVSCLRHYLENYMYGETELAFHADNCVAQNKNNLVLAYFAWRVNDKAKLSY